MRIPGGGRNDIPNRLKRHFFAFNLVLPSITSIDDLYGQMLRGRFQEGFSEATKNIVEKLTGATIDIWRKTKTKMLPTPSKFHYVFSMVELSRTFQGILLTTKDVIQIGGSISPSTNQAYTLLRLWKNEVSRVFEDKLTNNQDKNWFTTTLKSVISEQFGTDMTLMTENEAPHVDFFRTDEVDEDDNIIAEAPRIYEAANSLVEVREKVQEFLVRYNEEFPARRLDLVLFDDALRHLIRISRVLRTPRGSALLVGVGGSGKQSLTRLAAYIARQKLFQITLTKTYNIAALKDDLRVIYKYVYNISIVRQNYYCRSLIHFFFLLDMLVILVNL